MKDIFLIREQIIVLWKKYEGPVLFMAKVIVGVIIFSFISKIGVHSMLNNIPFILLLGVLTAILPAGGFFILLMLTITARLFLTSIELSVLVFLFMMLAYLFYIRIFPKQSLLIIAMALGFYFKIPYAVPIFAGLYVGLSGICPVVIGVCVWHFLPLLTTLAQSNANTGFSPLQMPETFIQMYIAFFNQLATSQSLLVSGLIFSVTALFVYGISFMSFDYSAPIAIMAGGVVSLIGFFIAKLVMHIEISVLQLILGDIVATAIVLGIHFFDVALDYPRAEHVQFQDGENYYYVKVIPKIKVSKQKTIRQEEDME